MGNHDELLRKRELREDGIDPYAAEPDQDDIETTITLIAGLAAHVRTTHQAYKDAIMENDKTADELVTKVLEAARPALPALVGKIERRSVKTGGVQTSQEHHELRGVLLVDRFIERTLRHEGEIPIEGEYGGVGLYWLEDGRLAFGKRTGTWSRSGAHLTGLETWLRPVEVDEAVKKFRVVDVVKGLLEAIGKQGRLGELAEKVRAHTAKLATHLAAMAEDLGLMRASLRFDESALKGILQKHCMTLSNVKQVSGVRFNIDQGDPGDPRDRGQTVTVEVDLELELEKP